MLVRDVMTPAVLTVGPAHTVRQVAKQMAARLQIYGFVTLEEVGADGTARRLRPSEAVEASAARPWRVSKPSYGVSLAARAS